MKKYLEVARTTFYQYFVIRLNFVLWRVRQLIFLLLTFFIWSSIFEGRNNFFSYTKPEMLTYILLASFIGTFALASRTYEIGEKIVSGNIIENILKPIPFFNYYLAKDMADKLTNIFFAFFEISLVIVLFQPPLFIQTGLLNFLFFFIFMVIGMLISFFFSLSLSFISFWTIEYWAVQFIFFMLVFFLSGTYFPLDILPKPLFYILLITPFPYFYYLPTKIFVKGIDSVFIVEAVLAFVWVYLSFRFARFLWNKGLKSYNFFGR